MIYKRFEFSQSLNGQRLLHIARNSAGIVVFREESENQLKKTIDQYLKHKQEEEELASAKDTQKLAEKAKKKKKSFLG